MQTLLFILIILLLGLLAGIFLIYRKLQDAQKPKEGEGNLFLMLQQQLQDLTKTMDMKMTETHKAMSDTTQHLHQTMQSQFGQSTKLIQGISDQSNKIISNVTERLTKLDETNKQVMGVADQLQGLENILKNPKQRGILGEYYLEQVLQNVMPIGSYQMQYKFNDGTIVDAVIFIKDKVIPIDSKFSLENYNRILEEKDPTRKEEHEKVFKADLKKRIDETSKYIKPGEGTMDFSFMFIPSEGIYYDILINKNNTAGVNTQDLIEYAFKERHVVIVSPTSFFAYLQTVMQGLRAMQIEESAKEIRTQVEKLGKHLLSYEDYLRKMGTNLGTTVNMYNAAYKEFVKIDKDVMKIGGGETTVEVLQLEKPQLDL